MHKQFILFLVILFSLSACTENDYKKPTDPLEAGRDFIRFALDGQMKNASLFILKDPTNDRLFGEIEKKYESYSKEEKTEYKNANIIINKSQDLNDSTTLINYANSYKKENRDLKLVKRNGEWWVDFKYTFVGDPVAQ